MSKIQTYSVDYNLLRKVARENASSKDRGETPILSEERESATASPTVSEATDSPRSTLSRASSESFGSPRAEASPETKSINYLLENIFSVEQTVHPELKAFHERLTSAETSPLTEREKAAHFTSLVESMKVGNPDLAIPPSYQEFPASKEMKEFLRHNLDPKTKNSSGESVLNRNVGALAAKAALMIADERPDLEMRTQLDKKIETYTEQQTQTADFSRATISLRKNGSTFTIRARSGLDLESYKTMLQLKNEELSLGLTGEQMEYIIRSTDQAGTQTTGQNFKMRIAGDSDFTIPPIENRATEDGRIITTKERALLVEISPGTEGQKITLTAEHAGFLGSLKDMFQSNSSLTLETVETDISALKGDKMLLGICTSEVPTKFTASIINSDLKFPIPASVERSLPEDFDHIQEFCNTKIKATADEDIDSPAKCAELIAASHPKLRNKLAIAASEVKGYDRDDLIAKVQEKITASAIEFDTSKSHNNSDLANYLAGKNSESGIPTGRNYDNPELSTLIAGIVKARNYTTEEETAKNIKSIVCEYRKTMNMDVKQTAELAVMVVAETPLAREKLQDITANVVHEVIAVSAEKQAKLAARPAPKRLERREEYAAEVKIARRQTANFAKQGLAVLQKTCGLSSDEASRILAKSYITASPETRSKAHGQALRKAFESMETKTTPHPPAPPASRASSLHK